MKVLFAAPEQAWGGILNKFRAAHPDLAFTATGAYRIDSLAGYDVLIPTMCRVDAALLASADRLRLIQQMGTGLEGVDIAAAQARGIMVANVPSGVSGNADSVAELGIYLLLGLLRKAWEVPAVMQAGRLGRPMGGTLQGKTIGLVGLGDLGKALLKKLAGFDVRTIGIRSRPDPEFAERYGLDWVGGLAELPQLLAEADMVVLCLPDTAVTHGLFDRAAFAAMRPGSLLVNLGRGGVVEREALLEALQNGTLGGAGLDVFWQEPPDPQDPIFSYPVIATPHIGGITDTSLNGIFQGVSTNLKRLQSGEPILYQRQP